MYGGNASEDVDVHGGGGAEASEYPSARVVLNGLKHFILRFALRWFVPQGRTPCEEGDDAGDDQVT